MGFIWVQDISIGASIDSADIMEIRNAADSVKDNLCLVDNVGALVGEDGLDLTGEDGTHNPAHQNPDNAGDDGLDLTGEDTTHNPTYQSPDNNGEVGSDLGSDRDVVYDWENTAEEADDHSTDNPANYPTNKAAELGSDKSGNKSSV